MRAAIPLTLRCFAAIAVALSAAGCDSRLPVDSYTARGEVEQLPDPKDPRLELMIHHEAIPEFRGEGADRGMASMSMPFPVRKGVSLADLGVGDKVEFSFEVVCDPSTHRPKDYALTSIHKLAADTALNFGSQVGH